MTKIKIKENVKFVVIDPFLDNLNEFKSFGIFTINLSKFVFKNI
jgi:hypothetical protein